MWHQDSVTYWSLHQRIYLWHLPKFQKKSMNRWPNTESWFRNFSQDSCISFLILIWWCNMNVFNALGTYSGLVNAHPGIMYLPKTFEVLSSSLIITLFFQDSYFQFLSFVSLPWGYWNSLMCPQPSPIFLWIYHFNFKFSDT